MKIALVAPDIPDYALAFAEHAADVADVTLFASKQKFSGSHPAKLDVRYLDWPRQSDVPGNMAFMLSLARSVRELSPDIAHFLMEGHVWFGPLAHCLGSAKILTTMHDVTVHPGDFATQKIPRAAVNLLLRRSDAVLLHGAHLREQARALPVLRSKSIVTFPHPPLRDYKRLADAEGWRRPQDGVFRVLFFGRFYQYKGVGHLMEAAERLATRPDIEFIFAGDGPEWGIYRERARALPNVRALDRFIPHAEGARLFAEADLVTLPYIEGSQSGVLMIALPFETPVLATRVGEIARTIEETQAGMLIPPGDSAALASAIAQLADDKELHRRLVENARHAMRGAFAPEALSSRLADLYRSLMCGADLQQAAA